MATDTDASDSEDDISSTSEEWSLDGSVSYDGFVAVAGPVFDEVDRDMSSVDRLRLLREVADALGVAGAPGNSLRAKRISRRTAIELPRSALIVASARLVLFAVFPTPPSIAFATAASVADVVGALRRLSPEGAIVTAALVRLQRRGEPLPTYDELVDGAHAIWREPGLTDLDDTPMGRCLIVDRLVAQGVLIRNTGLALGRLTRS